VLEASGLGVLAQSSLLLAVDRRFGSARTGGAMGTVVGFCLTMLNAGG
jgi:hypothetical protein